MFKILLLLLCWFCCYNVYAQKGFTLLPKIKKITNVYALATDKHGNIYAGGIITNATNCYNINVCAGPQNIYKWNGTTWSQVGILNTNDRIDKLTLDSMGNIYVAVNKWLTNFSTMSHIHKWDGSQWIQLPINKLLNNRITCMLTDKTGNLYVAGLFTNDSTTHLKGRKFVAKWDGVQWSEVGNANSKLNANEAITTMYFDSAENLYVRGGFTDSITYTKGTKYIAKWDGLQWSKFACDTTFVKKANSYGLRIDNNNNFFVSSKKK